MHLLPGWNDRLLEIRKPVMANTSRFSLPKNPHYFNTQVNFVATADQAEAMADFAEQRAPGWVGLDTEFRYDRPPLAFDNEQRPVFDLRSIKPLLLSLATVGPVRGHGTQLFRFVVDLRSPEVISSVRRILQLPCLFVAHFARAELFCLWQLGLIEPRRIWDTMVCEQAMSLGRNHKGYKIHDAGSNSEDAEATAAEEAKREDEYRLKLVATCQRYGISYPFEGDKDRLQRSFLDHDDGAPFSQEQIEYAAADAVAAAALLPHQLQAAMLVGLVDHLQRIEMEWVTTNARMIWRGIRVDDRKCEMLRAARDRHMATLNQQLAEQGVDNVRSHRQLVTYFRQHSLLRLFRQGDSYSFNRDQLSRYQHRHPAIHLIQVARRVLDLRKERILTGELVGVDGRVHPDHRQLGTHTGRQSSRWPNVLGLGRVFRPLIVPEHGRGIGEVDLSQIEVGIAAAVYRDPELVEMFNSGDVYAAMAQRFFSDQLTEEDRQLGTRQFKSKYPSLRDQMKICTLGIIFGLTPHGIAGQLGRSQAAATILLREFMDMFPTLRANLNRTVQIAQLTGFASTSTGLRRYRARKLEPLTNWERNWLKNHPVQGTAAALFKEAGNRLDRLYQRYDAWLLLAVHDAFVFEAPLELLAQVAELTDRVMREVVEEHFPQLRSRTEINISRPECWNKDGHSDSIDRWIRDPMYTL